MSYQVLARKWRPKRFADLIGQEHVVRALSNALTQGRLHHAYLLTGTRGVGKTTIARILAKSLNCEMGIGADPCGECAACRQIDSGRFVDLLEIDAASNTGIDNIRELLENAQYMPTIGRYKVYIIDEVHMLSKNAFNAMLKTLEEPPAHVKFILATTDPQKIPVTVLSRCLQFSLRNMSPQQVAAHLARVLENELVPFEAGALNLLGRAAAGSMRDAMSLLDQAIAYGVGEVWEEETRAMLGAVDRRYIYIILDALADADGPRLMAEANALVECHINFDGALTELALLLHQIALAQTVPQAIAYDDPERAALFCLGSRILPDDIQLYYQIAVHGRRDLALAPDEHAGFIMTLLRMLAFHPTKDTPSEPIKEDLTSFRPQKIAINHSCLGSDSLESDIAASGNTSMTLSEAPTPSITTSESLTVDTAAESASSEIAPPEVPVNVSNTVSAVFDGDWPALVNQLGVRMGAVRMLALNAVLKKWTPDRFDLAVPEGFRHMAARDYQEKLKGVLTNHFGRPVDLVVTVEELGSETPATLAIRCRQEQALKAQATLTSDSVVQQLMHEFNAVLLTETVQPV